MPLARIEIEQVEPNRWVAELECGDRFRRYSAHSDGLRSDTFAGIWALVEAKYREVVTDPLKSSPGLPSAPVGNFVDGFLNPLIERAADIALAHEPDILHIDPSPAAVAERAALFVEAERLGIDVDRRWGLARLQREIDAVRLNEPDPEGAVE